MKQANFPIKIWNVPDGLGPCQHHCEMVILTGPNCKLLSTTVQQYCVLCAFHSPFSPELVAVCGVPLAAVLPPLSLSATGVAGAASSLGAAVEAAVASSHAEAAVAAVARR